MTRINLIILRAVTPLLLAALSFNASAQSMKGKVVDENNEPLAYASVMLQKADSSYISGTMTDTLGVFVLEPAGEASMIHIYYIGYESYVAPVRSDIGTVQMVPDREMLNRAIVKSYLPKTVIKGDAFVTAVENSVLAEAGSANDVLKKLPGVISTSKGFEVIGKGTPIIYINGRLVRDNNELEQLNSKDIKSVDVVQNPGARYDATVKAVIRIQTIRKVGDGFSFDLRSSVWQSSDTDLNETINMNYRHNGLDVFGSLAYTQNETFQDTDLFQTLQSAQKLETDQTALFTSRVRNLTPTLGINWQISDKHSAGIRYRPDFMLNSSSSQDSYAKAWLNGVLDDNTHTVSKGNLKPASTHQVNMYYNGTVGKLGIDFNADFHDSRSNTVTEYNESSELQEDRALNTESRTHNRLYAAKLTLTYPLFNGLLTAGSECSDIHRKDDYINGEGYVPTTFSKIHENEVSAYLEYVYPFRFGSISAGVRYEHIGFDYYENDILKEDQSRRYDNFYPNASFNAAAGPFQFLLSYSAKTTRPHYSYLSNSLIYIDRYSMQQGNPLLKPEMNHDLTFTAVWKYIQAGASYQVVKDAILHRGTVQNGNNDGILIYYDNFGKAIPAIQVFVAASPTIGIWYPRLTVALVKQWLTMDSLGKEVNLGRPIPVVSFSNSIVLPKGFMLNADYTFQGKGDSRVYRILKAQNVINLSVRKSFLKNALSVEIFANDILDGQIGLTNLFSDTYSVNQWSRMDTRNFGVTLRYNFNSAQSKYKGTGAGTSQKDRM